MSIYQETKQKLGMLPDKIAAINKEIALFTAKVKRMPQGVERWEFEEWIIRECHSDPNLVRTKPSWSQQDWLINAIELKEASRRYRGAGKLAAATACEADAEIAEKRAAWMARAKLE